MTRFFKISILTMLCVFLVAVPAMAGTILFNVAGSNAMLNVALEAMNASRTYSLPGSAVSPLPANAAAIIITSNTSLASSNLLTVTFANGAAFSGTTVALCAYGTNSPIASSNSVANTPSLLFQLTANAISGQQVFITDDPAEITPGAGNCNLANGSLSVHFQPVTSAQVATVTYADLSSGGTSIDVAASAAKVANITSQFSTSYAGSTSTIDYINGAANGSMFSGPTNAAVGGNASINYVAMNINAVGAAPSAGLTVNAILSLQDSASWQAVKDVYVSNSGLRWRYRY